MIQVEIARMAVLDAEDDLHLLQQLDGLRGWQVRDVSIERFHGLDRFAPSLLAVLGRQMLDLAQYARTMVLDRDVAARHSMAWRAHRSGRRGNLAPDRGVGHGRLLDGWMNLRSRSGNLWFGRLGGPIDMQHPLQRAACTTRARGKRRQDALPRPNLVATGLLLRCYVFFVRLGAVM